MKKLFWFFLLCNCNLVNAQQDYFIEGVQINAYKYDQIKSYLANPVYVIDSEYISNNPGASLSSLLNQLPGIHVENAFGSKGSPQQYTMRGGQTSDISILINGVPISDDSQISNFQDLNLIDVNQIEKIEVISGGSSTLYGSNSSAGIVNIVLKDSFLPQNVQARINYGSWNTAEFSVAATLPIVASKLQVRPSYYYSQTEGFSSATDSIDNQNFDRDGASQFNYTMDLGWYVNEKMQINARSQFVSEQFEFDSGAFQDGDDQQDSNQWITSFTANHRQQKGRTTANVNYITNSRNQFNEFASLPNHLYSTFESKQFSGDIYQMQDLVDRRIQLSLLGGLSFKQSQTDQFGTDYFSNQYVQNISSDSARFTLIDPYLTLMTVYDEFGLDLGLRYHIHNQYENQLIYHIKPTINLISTQHFSMLAKAGLYSSFNTPSLYQLYSVYGNEHLTPEKSKSIEATLGGELFNAIDYSVTWYQRKEENSIGFSNLNFAYENVIGQSEARGVEMQLQSTPIESLSIQFFYSKNKRDRAIDSYKMPKHKWGISNQWQINDNLVSTTDFQFVGERGLPFYNSATFETEVLNAKAYQVLNERIIYRGLNQVQFFGAVNNILNQEYLDNYGYNSTTRNFMIGAQLSIQ